MESFKTSIVVGVIIVLALVIGFFSMMVYNVKSTEYVVKQAAITGELTVYTQPGWICKCFGDVFTYPRTMQLYFSDDKEDTDDLKRDEFAGALIGTFTGNSTAKISAFIKVQLPSNTEKIIELHRDWKTPYNVVMDMMFNSVSVGIKSVSPLFTPEEAFVDKRPEFQQLAREVMERGEFKTYTTDVVVASDTTQRQKQVKLVTIKDSTGRNDYVVVKPSIFTKYDIGILQFDIKEFKFDEKTAALIAAKKEFEQQRVAARSEAETAMQREKTIKAQAEANIAQKEGEAKVQLIQEVTEARKKFEVAEFAAKEAAQVALKIKAEGDAQAYANRALVSAGLTPLERATIEKETKIGVAEAMSKWSPPQIVITGDGKGGGAMEPLMLNQYLSIVEKLSK